MIEKIRISNFYSIRENVDVSFVASKDQKYGEDWIVEVGGTRILKALLLYGPNFTLFLPEATSYSLKNTLRD